jgi:hypothetical protein
MIIENASFEILLACPCPLHIEEPLQQGCCQPHRTTPPAPLHNPQRPPASSFSITRALETWSRLGATNQTTLRKRFTHEGHPGQEAAPPPTAVLSTAPNPIRGPRLHGRTRPQEDRRLHSSMKPTSLPSLGERIALTPLATAPIRRRALPGTREALQPQVLPRSLPA